MNSSIDPRMVNTLEKNIPGKGRVNIKPLGMKRQQGHQCRWSRVMENQRRSEGLDHVGLWKALHEFWLFPLSEIVVMCGLWDYVLRYILNNHVDNGSSIIKRMYSP